jgi:hypothetical protein
VYGVSKETGFKVQGIRCKVYGSGFKVKGKKGNRSELEMGRFMELNVWKRAKDLAVFVYRMTGQAPFNRDFSLCDQIRRAAVSIPSNIAEGDELDTNK